MDDAAATYQLRSSELLEKGRAAAISPAAQRRPIVMVLGMHRSGTSLCSHILSMLGIDMADQIPGPGHAAPAADNPRGHWERWEIVEFHDRILGLFNRTYYTPFHDFPLPVAWWADPRVVEIRREMIAFLDKRIGDVYFGFKDPRTVRMMPVWNQIANELKLAPKIVFCLRNPAQVARSLQARDGLDLGVGEYRWLLYMIDFFRYIGKFDYCTVEYEAWFEDPRVNVVKLQNFLNVDWQQSESGLDLVLSGIVDPALRHDEGWTRKPSQPLVRSVYKLAARAGQDAAAHEQIAYVASQFLAFQQLQVPLQHAFESIAGAAAKLPAMENDVADLRAAIGERAEAAETMGAEIAALREAVAQREQEARESAAASARAEAEVADLRAATDALRQAVARADGALRQAVAKAEHEARQHIEAAHALRDSAALAASALQAEIAALQSELAAEQQVGKAIAAALRTDVMASPGQDRPAGWWQATLRSFRFRSAINGARQAP